MICIINPTILKSESNELVLKIDGRNITLDLSKCAANWSKKTNMEASKCVATRNIIEKSFVFQTEPQAKIISDVTVKTKKDLTKVRLPHIL